MLLVPHRHEPLYRVARAGWHDPLDVSYSQLRSDNRWNTPEFPALYACCSERVARAVALEVFRIYSLVLEDLPPSTRPQLAELGWQGEAVDVASAEGIAAASFPATYPESVSRSATQRAAAAWHEEGREGVVCRSASLARLGFSDWQGSHEPWGEVAIFVQNARHQPRLIRRRADDRWLRAGPRAAAA